MADRPCPPRLDAAVACGSSGSGPRVRPRATPVAMSAVAAARTARVRAGGQRAGGGRTSVRARDRRRPRPGHACRTPAVGTMVVPGAADGQSADRSLVMTPPRFLKAGPAGGRLRRPSSRRQRPDGRREAGSPGRILVAHRKAGNPQRDSGEVWAGSTLRDLRHQPATLPATHALLCQPAGGPGRRGSPATASCSLRRASWMLASMSPER